MIASGASFLPTTCACSGWPVSLSSINARQPQPEWAPYFRRSDARPDALVDTIIKAKRLPVGPPDSLTSPRVIGSLESSGGRLVVVNRRECGGSHAAMLGARRGNPVLIVSAVRHTDGSPRQSEVAS
jgi:hypothetical protein